MYESLSDAYNLLHKEEQMRKYSVILSNLEISPEDKLLDVACGTGIFLELVDCDKIGIDTSIGMLNHAINSVTIGDAENLHFKDESFDVVTCITALHNFENPEKAIIEMRRVAKKTIAITVLKKSKNYGKLLGLVKKHFPSAKLIEDRQDSIFIAKLD